MRRLNCGYCCNHCQAGPCDCADIENIANEDKGLCPFCTGGPSTYKAAILLKMDRQLLFRIDRARGDISRTRFIVRAIEKRLGTTEGK